MSFFKVIENEIWEAPIFVSAPTYDLFADLKDTYELPIDNWYWFETMEEAQTFFNIFPNVTEPSGI